MSSEPEVPLYVANSEATAHLDAADAAPPPPTYAQLWRAARKATLRSRRICVRCACYNIGALLGGSKSATHTCDMSHTLAAGDTPCTHCATHNAQCVVVSLFTAILFIIVGDPLHACFPGLVSCNNASFETSELSLFNDEVCAAPSSSVCGFLATFFTMLRCSLLNKSFYPL
jgi:hypothetical protein